MNLLKKRGGFFFQVACVDHNGVGEEIIPHWLGWDN